VGPVPVEENGAVKNNGPIESNGNDGLDIETITTRSITLVDGESNIDAPMGGQQGEPRNSPNLQDIKAIN